MYKKEIIETIIDLYEQARYIILPNNIENPKIRRGRSRIVAGQTEELFAHLVSQIIPKVDKVLVDQPISFRPLDKAKTIYPDVLPIIDNEIKFIVDLKMDLGMKRDQIANLCNNAAHLIEEIKGKNIKYKDGITKEEFNVKASSDIAYLIVVVSKLNINKKALDAQVKDLELSPNLGKVKLYFLTDVAHPNWQDSQAAKEQILLLPDFDRLIEDIQSFS